MVSPIEIVKQMTPDRFAQILAASPKNFREELFRKAGIRVKGGGAFSLSAPPKTQLRTAKLLSGLAEGEVLLEDDVFEEVIRNYLYTRRPMLADALDHLQVAHDNGLTDQDLSFLEELPVERRAALRKLLESKYERADVDLYLSFMNIKDA
jgi:hypothetical protein